MTLGLVGLALLTQVSNRTGSAPVHAVHRQRHRRVDLSNRRRIDRLASADESRWLDFVHGWILQPGRDLCRRFSSYGVLQQSQPTLAVAWLNWLQSWMWAVAFRPLITLLPLLSPDGELLSSRWRVVPWASAVWMVCLIAAIGMSAPSDHPQPRAWLAPTKRGALPTYPGPGPPARCHLLALPHRVRRLRLKRGSTVRSQEGQSAIVMTDSRRWLLNGVDIRAPGMAATPI